jgi:hypothetical protein
LHSLSNILIPQHLDRSASARLEAQGEALRGVSEKLLVQKGVKLWHHALACCVREAFYGIPTGRVIIAVEKTLRAIFQHTEGSLSKVVRVLDMAIAKALCTSFDSVALTLHSESPPDVTFATVERFGPAA